MLILGFAQIKSLIFLNATGDKEHFNNTNNAKYSETVAMQVKTAFHGPKKTHFLK